MRDALQTTTTRRNLLLLWSAQLISVAGDAMYHVSLMWLILEMTGSSTATGFVAMSAYLPAMLFGLYAGVLADRHNRMGLMVLANLTQALTVLIIPVLLVYNVKHVVWIGLLAFLRATFGALFPPAFNAFVPTIVAPDRLTRVNSLLSTSGQLAWLLGPALAGILLGAVSLRFLFVLDALSFLIAIGLLLLVVHPDTPLIPGKRHPYQELREGIRYVLRHETLGFLIGLTIVNNLFIMGPAIVGTPILVKEALGGTASQYAFVEAGLAAGMLLGSLLVYRIGGRVNSGLLLLIGMILDGTTYSIFYWAQSVTFVLVFIVIHAVGIPMITISRTVIIQRHAPNRYHGRLFSMVHLAVVGMTALSSALVGIAAAVVDIQVVFLVIGIGAALCGFVGLLHPKITALT
jgi:MFS family permease